MNPQTMTNEQIRQVGLEALYEKLGQVGLARFLQQFETGKGDYTAERHTWLSGSSIPDIVREIEQRRGVK